MGKVQPSPFGGVDHVAVLVADIDASLPEFVQLVGSWPVSDEILTEPPVRLIHFDLGNVDLQLVQPTAEGALSRDLAVGGKGLHHICFRVSDIEAARGRLGSNLPTFIGGGGDTACFLSNRPGGLYVELIERRPRAIVALVEVLRVSAEYWAAESARDMTAMLASFSHEAEVVNQDGRAVGHKEIAAMYRKSFDEYPMLSVEIEGGYCGDTDHLVAFSAILADRSGSQWQVRGVNQVRVEAGLITRLRSFEDKPSLITAG